ncbi:MAG: 4-alpha-glucanotransferase [Bacteroidales bacterium]|nr:4-alpha-glucanotransferase [Bacteroidales bacterium]
MARRFRIHYNTVYGEKLVFETKTSEDGPVEKYDMNNVGGMHSYTDENDGELWYRYAVDRNDGIIEERHFRHLVTDTDTLVLDTWRSPEMPNDPLKSKAFADAVFASGKNVKAAGAAKENCITICLRDPRLGKDEAFCIVSKQFINWDTEKALVMKRYADFTWQYEIKNDLLLREIEFKFGIWDTKNKKFKRYEDGQNRYIEVGPMSQSIVVNYDAFNYTNQWKAAGVAVPVFSLRTTKSRGCGEFCDIKAMADWCEASGLKVIQLLPINDTTATFSFKDSYPYNAISVMALHPNYISVETAYDYYGLRISSIDRETALYLNDLNMVDYDRTREWKKSTLKKLYDQKRDEIIEEKAFAKYFKENSWWIKDYAAFAYLRDENHTPNYRLWATGSKHTKKLVDSMFAKNSAEYDGVMFRVFIQYHLEKQLSEAIEYSHSKGVAIKGDLPIGINPNSVEAWVEPELFNFGLQAGAPPDFFSRDGQNWGFPIYNWDKMSENGYEWWERRLGRMQQFFDVFRIDHILGFFRIWSIPRPYKSGLMGVFSPAMPYSAQELKNKGFGHDLKYFINPVVSNDYIYSQLGEYADAINAQMFDSCGELRMLKKEYADPAVIDKWVEENVMKTMSRERIRQGMANIMHEVLFVCIKEGEYHPRIMLTETARFQMLNDHEKNILRGIHDDFFYNRHNEFWKECATRNLNGMLRKCKMLVCGEDLGMIPASVPMVMKRMQILALELQRMPKLNWERYGNCSMYDYLSVCATSSHDISSIRGWWEENPQETQWYYNNVMRHTGAAPVAANGDIVKEIVEMHLMSPSMLCINPIQDYAGTVDNMPHLLPHEERINQPADPNHYWRYRMPFCIDEAVARYPQLHTNVRNMVEKSGRLN